ncbi:HNH endonuclease signature motif containing protein [Streptomyces sp. NPDC003077]|uniref:HNH endonuclease signature motif containing protein n=1 Tax=Streptomyces sp. NPDC003077 TaxID=3154443 RepID=UPI0033B931C6
MPDNRPPIPRRLDRRVRVEAGHRCAVPVCRMPIIEIAHIIPWAKVKKHEFDNLIALCPTCHALFDRGHIDRAAMRQYKSNLSPLSPFSLISHPDHIDLLSAYQKYRIRMEAWFGKIVEFNSAVERRVPVGELRKIFMETGVVAKDAANAWILFTGQSPRPVHAFADVISYGTIRWSSNVLRHRHQPDLPLTAPVPEALPTMWADLHNAIHEVLNQ